MLRGTKGFTLIELVVIIVVIAILATIATLGLNKYLEDGRDSRRTANVTTISEALEKYYDKNGEYPGCSTLTSDAGVVSQTVLPGIDQSALVVPDADAAVKNSISCNDIAATTEDIYQYKGDGSTTCSTGSSCLSYTLRYREEASDSIKEIQSRRSASIATSGLPTLNANGSSFNAIQANWSAVLNASTYQLQVSTSNSFLTTVYDQSANSLSRSVTGLSYSTSYFLRVRATTNGSVGQWSNVVNTSTQDLDSPALTVTPSSATASVASWTSISGATGYNIQWSTNQSTWSTLAPTTTSQSVTGLTGATLYYYRVQAKWNASVGPWSPTVSSYTNPADPTGVTITAAMSGTSAVGTPAGTCANGTIQYQTRNRNTNTTTAGTWTVWTTTWASPGTVTISSTAPGYQYGFQVRARCLLGTTPSGTVSPTTIANAVRNFAAPSAPSVSASTSGTTTTFTRTSTPTCSGNGVVGYQYKRTTDSGSTYAFAAITATSAATNTSTQGYAYGIEWQARCTNTYATGPWSGSGTASYVRPVSAPTSQVYNGYRGAWDIMYLEVNSSCGAGAQLYGAVDVHTWDWAWRPGNYYGWRRDSLGWVIAEGWRNNYTQTGSQSSSGIPSGSRWNVGGWYRCQNYATGRNSGGNVWQESGIYTAS